MVVGSSFSSSFSSTSRAFFNFLSLGLNQAQLGKDDNS